MIRRRSIQLSSALLLVIVISLSGLWAEQVRSESQARGAMTAAQSHARAALAHATAVGLLPAEMAALQRREAQLSSARAPHSSPFWRSNLTHFYDLQSRAYAALSRNTARTVAAVTQSTRSQAEQSLQSLTATISTARGLGLDVTGPSQTYAQQNAHLSAMRLPREYRRLTSQVDSAVNALKSTVQSRQDYVHSVLAKAGGSASGVARLAEDERATASGQASLLSLLTPRGGRYLSQLSALAGAVSAQNDATQAAVKEALLHDEVTRIAADYSHTIPAKMIVVSTEDQSARMFENGTQVYSTPVTTGGPELPTDHGVFHIYMKASPFEFHSPWPLGSPYYYPPTPVTYWMPFYGGEGLHDASWRSNFGPGSNLQPTDLGTGNYILGTHGCVNLPTPVAAWVWDWAPVGTTVVVT